MWLFRLITVIFLCVCLGSNLSNCEDLVQDVVIARGLRILLETGQEPEGLAEALQDYRKKHEKKDATIEFICNFGSCAFCNIFVESVLFLHKLGLTNKQLIADGSEFICTIFLGYTKRVCSGLIGLNLDIFMYIMDNDPNLTSKRFCGTIFQRCGCSRGYAVDWSVKIPRRESPRRVFSQEPSGSFKILHLSDFHVDPFYTPNGNAACGEPMCCQHDQPGPELPENRCGYWSDYRDADAPWHLVEETIRQVNSQDFDYVYYTGDIISHRVWDTTIESNTQTIKQLFDYFEKSFDVPVYPVFGNHEPHPLNIWPTESVKNENFTNAWLFKLVAESWSRLVGEDVSETVLKGGYYTVSPRSGFRIVAINSNLYYSFNWWTIFNDPDPHGQLKWLADTLKRAEENNESVHILSHVPTASPDCLRVWGRQYAKIVERFSNTITGQFCGHTHTDEFYVYYNSKHPIGVSFNGASVTPYTGSNPSYKIFKADSATFVLEDYEEWTFNLTFANSQSSELPAWYKLYSFVDTYGVRNLSPFEVDKVLHKMVKNGSLLDEYHKFKFRNSDVRPSCGFSCQRNNLCTIATAVYGDNSDCDRFTYEFISNTFHHPSNSISIFGK